MANFSWRGRVFAVSAAMEEGMHRRNGGWLNPQLVEFDEGRKHPMDRILDVRRAARKRADK